MSEERYIAAIEISSSKIIGAVGRAHSNGQVDIIAVEQERTVESVRYGIIQNLEDTSLKLARVLERLERKPSVSPRKIRSVFVGLSGRSLRSIPTSVRLNLPEDTEINTDIVERLRKDALGAAIDNTLEVVDAVPRKYRVGKIETTDPEGVVGNQIVAEYDIIVCRPELKRNITRVIKDKLNIQTMGFCVTALATGHLILTDQEKALGCMLVDMGAETTTVSIYRHKALYYLATLPFGGRHITRDITSLSILEDRAEEIKTTAGCAIPPENPSTFNMNGIKISEVMKRTVARSEEIVANITEQLAYAELKEKELPGGVICIGGGVKLNGMTELISRQLGLPVKIGRLPAFVVIDDLKGPSTEIVQVGSILYAGAMLTNENCLEIPVKPDIPGGGEANDEPETDPDDRPVHRKERREPNPNSLISRFKRFTTRIFETPPDDEDEDNSLF
ncbi:MAG: cell division protein FtsA [Muribaculaceae bacterium]|nr:cell division protein FtsA [Muribaculaceae bacterium]